MVERRRRFPTAALLGLILGICLVNDATATADVVTNACGVTARIHTPEDLQGMVVRRDGSLWLEHPRAGRIELLDGPTDPRFPREDVDVFVPVTTGQVEAALIDLYELRVSLEVDIFILPSLPASTLCSYATRDLIFLAPGFGPVDDRTAARLVVHELGHVLTWAYFDTRPEIWNAYMDLRGLDPVLNGPEARHCDRAREILAEDIRHLFGGDLAVAGAGIENPDLESPETVAGLRAFLGDVITGAPCVSRELRSLAYPNPCNPRATLELFLPDDRIPASEGPVIARIIDARGRSIRSLQDADVRNGRISLVWDGRDCAGREAPSGRYFYLIELGEGIGRGSLTLVR